MSIISFFKKLFTKSESTEISPLVTSVESGLLTDQELTDVGKGNAVSEIGKEVSIIRFVNSIVKHGYDMKASDIHIDPDEKQIRVRMRVDGILQDIFVFPKELASEIISRFKVLSGLRTDEHNAAQDGRFKIRIDEKTEVDVRLSIAPTYYGENAVLRLLAERQAHFSLAELGFSNINYEKVARAIKKPHGMILLTGPTGSGKTSTLYTILRTLNTPEVSIVTIEDPIEYSLQGIEQIQVNPRTGVTFANGLRSILRQDPDIIMVGEIRDEETAAIAVNAALTGHLLLSTLHTNDAVTTLPRLLDMKVEAFLIASTINIVIAQRLVRMICPDCKVKKVITDAELKSLQGILPKVVLDNNREFYKGAGCVACGSSGYYGRIEIHEVLEMTDAIREAVMRRSDASAIMKIAIQNGTVPLMHDGFQKALAGITTIEEILRVLYE
ncbi:MAG: GspE/PulE family protein [bacterium]|nr:GspE/PulE family protein [bacterium]